MKHINKIIKSLKATGYRTQLRRGFLSKGQIDMRRRGWLTRIQRLPTLAVFSEGESVERVDRWFGYKLRQAKEKKNSLRRKRKVSKTTNYYRR